MLVAATIERHGYDGLALATMMAGLILMAIGFLRLGTYIKYIPHPVTIGFTAGIAVIIFASQLRELLRADVAGQGARPLDPEARGVLAGDQHGQSRSRRGRGDHDRRHPRPAPLPTELAGLFDRRRGRGGADGCVATSRRDDRLAFRRHAALAAEPHWPDISLERIQDVLPDAFAFALLGGIESLLSAVVADAMSGRRHRSNCELVAQGVANIASPLFGGICATGTIARTATNVRSGAVGPVSGMMHSVFLLLFILVAAPLASYMPLAALAGLLATVAWNMAERHEFAAILTRSRGEAAVLLATFLLTVFRDLTEAIAVGVVLGSFVFMHRMANLAAVEVGVPLESGDEADEVGRRPY